MADDVYMRMGETQEYVRSRYGLKWSRAHITKLIHEGRLYGVQANPDRGWWLVSRASIDDLLRRP